MPLQTYSVTKWRNGDKTLFWIYRQVWPAATLAEYRLALRAPALHAARVLDDAGEVRRFVNVYVGDDEVGRARGLGAAVPDDATVGASLVPARVMVTSWVTGAPVLSVMVTV